MSEESWDDYGRPAIDTPEIRRAAELVGIIYETEVTGTPLHVELDDWNLDGVWVPWEPARDGVAVEAWTAAEELCALANAMTVQERASFLALADGHWTT